MAGQVSRFRQVYLTFGEEQIDLVGRHLEFVHTGPAGGDHVLGVVFVGRQADRSGFDAKRNVLAHQCDELALGGEVGSAGQNPRVIGIGAETGGQYRRVAVVEFDVQRATLIADREGLIEAAVFQP